MTAIDESWYRRPEGVPESVAAGGVVVREEKGQVLVALVQERSYEEYVLPKGHLEPGEDVEEAARREIAEEAGFTQLEFLANLGTRERLSFLKTEWKTIHYFLYRTEQVDVKPEDVENHDVMRWFPLESLPPMFWPEQRELLEVNRQRISILIQGNQ